MENSSLSNLIKTLSSGNTKERKSALLKLSEQIVFVPATSFEKKVNGEETKKIKIVHNTIDNKNVIPVFIQEDVFFEVDFPLKVSDKGNTINFEKFAAKLNVRLKYIYNLANTVVDFNAKNPGGIDRTALSDYDVNVTIFPYQNSLVYVIDDSKSLVMNQPYRFIFALKIG